MNKTLDEQIASVEREIKMRLWVYPKRVKEGKMSQEQAAHETDCMQEVLRTLSQVRIERLRVTER